MLSSSSLSSSTSSVMTATQKQSVGNLSTMREKMISRSGCRRREEKMSKSRKAMTTTNGTMTVDDFDVEKVKSEIRETIERISGKVAEMSGVTEKNLTIPSSSVEDTSIFVHNQLASAVKALENFEQSLDPLMMHSMETIAERHPVLAGAFAAFASGSFSVAVARCLSEGRWTKTICRKRMTARRLQNIGRDGRLR
jgi:hypothetical protein